MKHARIYITGCEPVDVALPADADAERVQVGIALHAGPELLAVDLHADRAEVGTWPAGEVWHVSAVVDYANPNPSLRHATTDAYRDADWRQAVADDATNLGRDEWITQSENAARVERFEAAMAARPDVVTAARSLMDGDDTFADTEAEYVRGTVELAASLLGLMSDYSDDPNAVAAALLGRRVPFDVYGDRSDVLAARA